MNKEIEKIYKRYDLNHKGKILNLLSASDEEIKKGSRSETLYKLTALLFEAGLKRKEVFKLIQTSKWNKFNGNKAKFILENLIDYYYNNPEELKGIYKEIAEKEGLKRAVADYISGMSDDYCLNTFNSIFVPKVVIY